MATAHLFADRFATVKNYRAFFLTGCDLNDRACYYVLACPPHKISQIIESNVDDMSKFGQVLYSGFGSSPSEDIKKMLKEKFNVEFPEDATYN